MIENLISRQDELLKNQDQNINKLISDLVKWITLKEIEKDDKYLNKLINKLISENKESTKNNISCRYRGCCSFQERY